MIGWWLPTLAMLCALVAVTPALLLGIKRTRQALRKAETEAGR